MAGRLAVLQQQAAALRQIDAHRHGATERAGLCIGSLQVSVRPVAPTFALQHRGKVSYDAGDYADARADFKRALFLRQEAGAPEDQLESTLLAIEAAERRRASASVAS